MPEIVVVVARAASHFGGFYTDEGDNRMIGETFTFDAKVIKVVSEAKLEHIARSIPDLVENSEYWPYWLCDSSPGPAYSKREW